MLNKNFSISYKITNRTSIRFTRCFVATTSSRRFVRSITTRSKMTSPNQLSVFSQFSNNWLKVCANCKILTSVKFNVLKNWFKFLIRVSTWIYPLILLQWKTTMSGILSSCLFFNRITSYTISPKNGF